MFLKSITFSVSNEVAQKFEKWAKNEVIIYHEWISKVETYKLLTEIDKESTNYSIQFFFSSKEELEVFVQLHLDLFIIKAQNSFGRNLLYFISLLEKI